jgi:hypothetical protein
LRLVTCCQLTLTRILLLSTALVVSINTIAGGRSSERNLMDAFLQSKTLENPGVLIITAKHKFYKFFTCYY